LVRADNEGDIQAGSSALDLLDRREQEDIASWLNKEEAEEESRKEFETSLDADFLACRDKNIDVAAGLKGKASVAAYSKLKNKFWPKHKGLKFPCHKTVNMYSDLFIQKLMPPKAKIYKDKTWGRWQVHHKGHGSRSRAFLFWCAQVIEIGDTMGMAQRVQGDWNESFGCAH
jgi:hypothetical protein